MATLATQTTTEPGRWVSVLVISRRSTHVVIKVCCDEKRCKKELLSYVKDKWTKKGMAMTPNDFLDPVGEYFDSTATESYSIRPMLVLT